MISSSEVLMFSSGDVVALPPYYRAVAHRLAETGRAVIEEQSSETEGSA
jgi:hypothetical protein